MRLEKSTNSMFTEITAKTSSRGITLRRDLRTPGSNENDHQS